MKLPGRELVRFRKALHAVDPSAFGLVDVDVYPGSSPYCARSSVVFRFGQGHQELLAAALGEAARSVSSRIGVQVSSGLHADGESTVCWLEYFPGGIRASSTALALQAFRTALVFLAARASGEALHAAAAEREAARAERMVVPSVFVQSRFLISAARSADIPVENIAGADSLWRFGWGSRSDTFFGTASLGDSLPGHQITWKKPVAKALFRELGLPTPKWRVVRAGSDPLRIAGDVGWPCVVKPVDQAFGRGVTANVASEPELRAAIGVAHEHSQSIMIEAHQPGFDHRLMVVDGQLVAAARRLPPSVTGDGRSTVHDLIERLNAGRDGTQAKGYLLPVQIDAEVSAMLARRNLSAQSVLPSGETVTLRSIANFSTGGSAEDVTGKVHPQIKGLAELLATAVGLRTAGIDYITPDISRPYAEVGGGFIEVNAMPRLRLLMADGQAEGEIASLLLSQRPGRIPVTMFVAGPGAIPALASTIRDRIRSRPGAAAAGAGWAQLGPTALPETGLNAFELASSLLRSGSADELIILWSAEEVREFGLPADRIDKAIVLDAGIEEHWVAPYCRTLVHALAADAALEAAFCAAPAASG